MLIASVLLLSAPNGDSASKKLGTDRHKSETVKQSEPVKLPEPQVPLSALHEALRAVRQQSMAAEKQALAAEKQAEAYKETWCSPPVVVQGVLALVGAGYLVFAGLQWRVLYWAFLADHRPRLGILHIALSNVPDEILVPNSEGQEKDIKVRLTLINRGGSDAQIIEGNVTLKVDKIDSTESRLRTRKLLPPFDIQKGIPRYSDERDTGKNTIIRAAVPWGFDKAMPVSGPAYNAADTHMAIHSKRSNPSAAFHVFGFFTYRTTRGTTSWLGIDRSYYTAFCRRYDPGEGGRFVAINESDYEYEY